MRKYLISLALLTALVVATPVNAVFYSGNVMMDNCNNTGYGESVQNESSYYACISFLAGINDTQAILVSWHLASKPIFCIPGGARPEQLRQVFLAYMKQKPEEWDLPASGQAIRAFAGAWPCKQ